MPAETTTPDATMTLTSESVTKAKVPFFDAYSAAARKKLDAPPRWQWYKASALDDGNTLIEGGVPVSGRKGRARWYGVKGQTCIVTPEEHQAACDDYEATTGKCHECAGSGKRIASVSIHTGSTYRDCTRCNASGRATPTGERTA